MQARQLLVVDGLTHGRLHAKECEPVAGNDQAVLSDFDPRPSPSSLCQSPFHPQFLAAPAIPRTL